MSGSMILVINSGSSTVKMALIDAVSKQTCVEKVKDCIHGEKQAIKHLLNEFVAESSAIVAVGHRVVHGGEKFTQPILLTASVLQEIESISYLAPLHNPSNLAGIHMAMELLPELPHIAVFDTAFHQSMPKHAYHYAVPQAWYDDYGVRRYGFHGISHEYIAHEAAKKLDCDFEELHILTAHLGNGCSTAAIAHGKSVDTSMGLTPLEGLVMGTRSGDVDPSLHQFSAKATDDSLDDITTKLNKESGLLGLSGLSHDMRDLLAAAEKGHEGALLAIDVFCYRLAKSLAALAVALDRLDAIVFTGGIGEHAALILAKTVQHLSLLNIKLDEISNRAHGQNKGGFIQSDESSVAVMVIPTNEEAMIAHCMQAILQDKEVNV